MGMGLWMVQVRRGVATKPSFWKCSRDVRRPPADASEPKTPAWTSVDSRKITPSLQTKRVKISTRSAPFLLEYSESEKDRPTLAFSTPYSYRSRHV